MSIIKQKFALAIGIFLLGMGQATAVDPAPPLAISQDPLFLIGGAIPPRAVLNVSNDNQLFFNAYPEYADLTGNGEPERGYNHAFDYFGYFDPEKCYSFNTSSSRFVPESITANKYCSGEWSGNFLNWLTMARIDTVRKILYGGKRAIDEEDLTVLERSYLPNDAHSWVRYYDGDDISQLTPFSLPTARHVQSVSEVGIARPPRGERNDSTYRRTFNVPGWTNSDVQLGDQIEIRLENDPGTWMLGVVRDRNLGGTPTIEIQITSFDDPNNLSGDQGPWELVNRSRRGISFCNTTASNTPRSQDVTDPPLLRVAEGNYRLWTANERWQCQWHEEENRTGHANMQVGGRSFSNGNDITASGIWGNSENPIRAEVGLGRDNYEVRVEACRPGLIGTEDCLEYPSGYHKPIGLLQEFGSIDAAGLLFGLMSGSYSNNLSGGVLRKNVGTFSDEVDSDTGQFIIPTSDESIVRTIDSFRLIGYNHGSGVYSGAGDDCGVGVRKNQMQDGRCMNWGNPQAELFAESLRYLAGLAPNPDFHIAGQDQLSDLLGAAWQDPVSEVEWCAPLAVVQFNASVNSFDNQLGSAVDGLPGLGNPDSFTNTVGSGEGLTGSQVFVGGANRLCTAETLGSLSDFEGICPEAPNQDGTYGIAGLAHYAWTNDLRPQIQGAQNVKTFGVSLAPAVPRIEIPRPGETEPSVVILPACENIEDGGLRCALADFQILEQDIDEGTGAFFIQWDVHEWGSDFDMDINGTLRYEISGNEITITTDAWSDSSSRDTGFGYIISGTTQDGFHAHSGINGYDRTNPVPGGPNCNNCRVTDSPTSHTYTIGTATAELLREPLFYAAKWGGYDKSRNFPSEIASWDTTGDGLPDNYVFATNPAALKEALAQTFEQILALSDRTSVTTESSRVREGSFLYRAEFNSEDWTGDVKALDPFDSTEKWSADAAMPTSRNLFASAKASNGDTEGVVFGSSLAAGSDVRARIVNPVPSNIFEVGFEPTEMSDGSKLLAFIAGSSADEGTLFRERETLIGDIINSELRFSGPVNEGWIRLSEDEGGQLGSGSYAEYADCTKQDPRNFDNTPGCTAQRHSAVFVGSNAGMLHAFDAEDGRELFGFIPRAVQSNLWRLAREDYAESGQKRAFVDGQVEVRDAYDGNQWRTILVGGLGAGGRSVYALDVSTPQSFDAGDVLWEITADEDSRIGHVYDRPRIVRLENSSGQGQWVAIFGNGYNAAEGKGHLFVVDLFSGETLQVIDVPPTTVTTGSGTNSVTKTLSSGLSAPGVLSVPTGLFAQAIYAGDIAGNMWRFEINGHNVLAPQKLFSDPDRRAITAAPTLARSAQGFINVFFGTGKLFEVGDATVDANNEPVQRFYALRDQNALIVEGDLGERELVLGSNGRRINIQSDNAEGWYLPFSVGSEAKGERVLRQARIAAGRLLIRTYEPNDDPCIAGGIVRDYPLDAISGVLASTSAGELEVLEREGTPSGGSSPVIFDPPTAPGSRPVPPLPDLEPADPPTDITGVDPDRGAWCPAFGFFDLDGNFVRLGTICDGRQTWRQIR